MSISREPALKWMQQNSFDDESSLVHAMAWCRQATSNHLSQCWPPHVVIRSRWMKLLRVHYWNFGNNTVLLILYSNDSMKSQLAIVMTARPSWFVKNCIRVGSLFYTQCQHMCLQNIVYKCLWNFASEMGVCSWIYMIHVYGSSPSSVMTSGCTILQNNLATKKRHGVNVCLRFLASRGLSPPATRLFV